MYLKENEKYKIELNKLVSEIMKSKWNHYDLPFERNFLAYISEKYPKDSFEEITPYLWKSIYKIHRDYKDLYKALNSVNKLLL